MYLNRLSSPNNQITKQELKLNLKMDDIIEKSVEQQFHGIDYIIKVAATTESLMIEIEQRNTGDIWKNQFTSQYLEEITAKTGNFKKYPVFLKMLLSSFAKQSDSVFIDVLTFQDLESLKQRKNQISAMAQSKLVPSNKRYLILSYIVEFDKVHYPLPLNYDESPPAEQMKATIAKLRSELDQIKLNPPLATSNESLRGENEMLKLKVKKMEEAIFQLRSNDAGVGIYQRQIEEQNKEITFMKGIIESKEREIIEYRNAVQQLKRESVSQGEMMEAMRRQQETEKALIDTNKKLIELEEDVVNLVEENHSLKLLEKKSRARITQLEQELQSTLQKSNQKRRQISQSPVARKSSSLHSRKSPFTKLVKKSNDKLTPRRSSRNNSIDSDTESSYLKKNRGPSPSNQRSKRKQPDSPIQQQKKSTQKVQPKQPAKPAKQTINLAQLKTESEEEERLRKKLIELRTRNKENNLLHTPSPSQSGLDYKSHGASQFLANNKSMSQSSFIKSRQQPQTDSSCSEDVQIDERINKLRSLMQMGRDQ